MWKTFTFSFVILFYIIILYTVVSFIYAFVLVTVIHFVIVALDSQIIPHGEL